MERQELIKRIEELPPERLAEVENFVESLIRRNYSSEQRNLHQALRDYASKNAGTVVDLDPELEAASTEHLLRENSPQ
jgi:hypothetical protein